MESIRELAYGRYQIDWMKQNQITFKDISNAAYNWAVRNVVSKEKKDFKWYVEMYGFNGSLWKSFDAFMDEIYEDTSYIASLLNLAEYDTYLNDLGKIKMEKQRIVTLKNLLEEDEVIATYGTDYDYQMYHCIAKIGSTDIAGMLEETLHRILDAGGNELDVRCIMGAFIPNESEKEEWTNCIDIDLSYVLPGTLLSFELGDAK